MHRVVWPKFFRKVTGRDIRQLPPEFPRHDVVHAPPGVCKTCGGSELRTVSETVTEVLAYVPARFEVTRHVRPACSCRKCETMVQAPMPDLPIPRGMVDASFLAHIVVAKFCDHLPLYRQAEIYARSGLDIAYAVVKLVRRPRVPDASEGPPGEQAGSWLTTE